MTDPIGGSGAMYFNPRTQMPVQGDDQPDCATEHPCNGYNLTGEARGFQTQFLSGRDTYRAEGSHEMADAELVCEARVKSFLNNEGRFYLGLEAAVKLSTDPIVTSVAITINGNPYIPREPKGMLIDWKA